MPKGLAPLTILKPLAKCLIAVLALHLYTHSASADTLQDNISGEYTRSPLKLYPLPTKIKQNFLQKFFSVPLDSDLLSVNSIAFDIHEEGKISNTTIDLAYLQLRFFRKSIVQVAKSNAFTIEELFNPYSDRLMLSLLTRYRQADVFFPELISHHQFSMSVESLIDSRLPVNPRVGASIMFVYFVNDIAGDTPLIFTRSVASTFSVATNNRTISIGIEPYIYIGVDIKKIKEYPVNFVFDIGLHLSSPTKEYKMISNNQGEIVNSTISGYKSSFPSVVVNYAMQLNF